MNFCQFEKDPVQIATKHIKDLRAKRRPPTSLRELVLKLEIIERKLESIDIRLKRVERRVKKSSQHRNK